MSKKRFSVDIAAHHSFHYFSLFSFLVLRALSWRREAAPLVYRQGTSNSQMGVLLPFWGVTLAVLVNVL